MSRGTKLWRGRTAPRRPRTDTTPAAVIFLGGDYPKIHTPTYISSLPTCVTCHARFGRTYPGRTGKRIKASTTQPAAITGVADRRGQCAHAADASWRRWAGDPTQQAAPHPLLAPREAKMRGGGFLHMLRGKPFKASTTQPAAITSVAVWRAYRAHAADASWRRWAGDPTQRAAPHPLRSCSTRCHKTGEAVAS